MATAFSMILTNAAKHLSPLHPSNRKGLAPVWCKLRFYDNQRIPSALSQASCLAHPSRSLMQPQLCESLMSIHKMWARHFRLGPLGTRNYGCTSNCFHVMSTPTEPWGNGSFNAKTLRYPNDTTYINAVWTWGFTLDQLGMTNMVLAPCGLFSWSPQVPNATIKVSALIWNHNFH